MLSQEPGEADAVRRGRREASMSEPRPLRRVTQPAARDEGIGCRALLRNMPGGVCVGRRRSLAYGPVPTPGVAGAYGLSNLHSVHVVQGNRLWDLHSVHVVQGNRLWGLHSVHVPQERVSGVAGVYGR